MMDLGRVAFEGYCTASGGLTHDGKPIPTWENLTPEVRANWRAAADTVKMFLETRTRAS